MTTGIDGAVDDAVAVDYFAAAGYNFKARYLWLRYHDIDPTPEGRISPQVLPEKYTAVAAGLQELWERERDAEAAWLLGDFLYHGRGGNADIAAAVALWEAAATQLYYPAMIDLGRHLLNSEDKMTQRRGLLLLRKAEKYGHVFANYSIAEHYRAAGEVKSADEYLQRAAAAGVVQAKFQRSGYGEDNGYAPGYMKPREKRSDGAYQAAMAQAIHRNHRGAMIDFARFLGDKRATEAVYLKFLAGSDAMNWGECSLYYPVLSVIPLGDKDGFDYLELDEFGLPRIRRMDWFYILTGGDVARDSILQMYAALPTSTQMDGDAPVGIHAYDLPGWFDGELSIAERAAEFFMFYSSAQGEEWYYLSYALAASLAGRGDLAIYGAWALEQATVDNDLIVLARFIRANGYSLLGMSAAAQEALLPGYLSKPEMAAALVEKFLPALTAPEYDLEGIYGIKTRDVSANIPAAIPFYDLATGKVSSVASPVFAPVNTVEAPLEPFVLD